MTLKIIYTPSGRALEYASSAVSLYRGCSHGCTYCFAPASTKTTREKFMEPMPKKDALSRLEHDLFEIAASLNRPEVLMSFTTDPCQPIEEKYHLTRDAIQLFNKFGIRYSVLTKGGRRSFEAIDLIDPALGRYATTLTLWKPEDELKWEPAAAPWTERIEALKRAHARGIRTWSSIEPVIDTAQSTYLIAESMPYVDEFRIGALNHMQKTVTDDQMTEFVRSTEYALTMAGKSFYFKKDAMPFVEAAHAKTAALLAEDL